MIIVVVIVMVVAMVLVALSACHSFIYPCMHVTTTHTNTHTQTHTWLRRFYWHGQFRRFTIGRQRLPCLLIGPLVEGLEHRVREQHQTRHSLDRLCISVLKVKPAPTTSMTIGGGEIELVCRSGTRHIDKTSHPSANKQDGGLNSVSIEKGDLKTPPLAQGGCTASRPPGQSPCEPTCPNQHYRPP